MRNVDFYIFQRQIVSLFAMYESNQAFGIQKGKICSLQDIHFIKQSVGLWKHEKVEFCFLYLSSF